jgi:geranylgeranylglycerol-phosphate geranylgeranyltransferase
MMAGTMVMNDVYDIEIDRVNNPNRPVASGRVGTRQALGVTGALSVTSLLFAAVLGLWTFLTALLATVLMAYYNVRGKRTGLPGNLVVSFNVALPFFYGGLAVGILKPLVLTFSALAFLANLGREIAKGIPDVQGDRLAGARTLAVSLGPREAGIVSASLFLIAVALSALPPLTGTVSLLYFPLVAVADAGFVHSSLKLVVDPSPGPVRKVKTWVLAWMFLGLLGFVLGGTL